MNIAAEHRDDEGLHLVLSTAQRRYRLNICGETTETDPLAYVLPTDAFWETRQAAVSNFHEHRHLGLVKKLPLCLAPGPSEHWRLNAGMPFRAYTAERHTAWLRRKALEA